MYSYIHHKVSSISTKISAFIIELAIGPRLRVQNDGILTADSRYHIARASFRRVLFSK